MEILFPPNQSVVFFNMSIVGFFLAFIYDLFKFKRLLFGAGFIALFIDDFVFWILAAVSFVFSIFVLNNGIFRWYELLFCLAGFMIYRLTLSRLVMPLLKVLSGIIRKMLTLLCYPISFVFKPFVYMFCYIKNKILLNKTKNSVLSYIYDLYPSGSEINE